MRSWMAAVLMVAGVWVLGVAYVWADQKADQAQPAVVSPQTRPAESSKAVLGQEAPGFALSDQDGKRVSLADCAGKIVVLEWVNPQCPYVQRHYKNQTMESLAEKYRDKGVVWLAINTTASAVGKDNKAWVEKYDLNYPILDDHDGKVGRLYGAKTTPHMFVIDRSGKIVYKGAIDDDPQAAKEHATNYVGEVLAKLTAGQEVAPRETKSYGCSVKYAGK
jgi:peroxiredoxin